MMVTRVEQHQINTKHPMFNIVDSLCFKSKNLYNYANYIIRQEFINNGKYIKSNDLDKLIQNDEPYLELGSQASQKLLFLLNKNWKSFFKAIKDYSKYPSKYLGRPKMPKYKKKDGRNIVTLKNIQFRIEEGYVYFSLKSLNPFSNSIKTNINKNDKLMQIRFIPRGNIYVMEIVYETNIDYIEKPSTNILGVDLGLNNFATLTNNIGLKPIIINGRILKSYNQYYNKQLAYYRSTLKKVNKLDWSIKLAKLNTKRFNKIKTAMHRTSKFIIDYCKEMNIDTIVIGNNAKWKQEADLGKTTQGFVQIPYEMFINQLQYKGENESIRVIVNEESYTSGTSFLDNEQPIKENYNKSRRIFRGLFKSNKGRIINSDVNGSLQIIKKVFPNAFADGIKGLDLIPSIINFG
jgi:putative transposase